MPEATERCPVPHFSLASGRLRRPKTVNQPRFTTHRIKLSQPRKTGLNNYHCRPRNRAKNGDAESYVSGECNKYDGFCVTDLLASGCAADGSGAAYANALLHFDCVALYPPDNCAAIIPPERQANPGQAHRIKAPHATNCIYLAAKGFFFVYLCVNSQLMDLCKDNLRL